MGEISAKSIDTATLSTGPHETPSACVTCEKNWIEIQYESSIPPNMPEQMDAAELKAKDLMPVELGLRFVITDVDQKKFRKVSVITGNEPTRVWLPEEHNEVLFTFEGERPSETLGVPEAEKPGESEEDWFSGLGIGAVSGVIKGINAFSTALDDLAWWLNEEFPLPGVDFSFKEGITFLSSKELLGKRKRGATGYPTIPNSDPPKSTAGQLAEGVAQFLVGFLPALGGVRILSGGAAVTSTGKLVQFTIAGAVADATVFDPHEKRLSNLIQQFPELKNPVTDYLAADPEDTKAEGRLKNVLEGMLFGALLDGFVRALRVMKCGVTRVVAKLQTKHRYIFYSETLEAVVDVLLRAARKAEPPVTAMLQEVAAKTKGVMAGLEYRIKSHNSLTEKIAGDVAKEGEIYSAVAARIKDLLRYTIVYEEKNYARSAMKALDEISLKGYKKVRIKNFWNTNGTYQGVNAVFETPRGYQFELQFHTEASLAAKEGEHKIYEKLRKLPAENTKEEAVLKAQQREYFDRVPIPPNATTVN